MRPRLARTAAYSGGDKRVKLRDWALIVALVGLAIATALAVR